MKLTLKRDLPLLLAALLVIWGLWYARPIGVEVSNFSVQDTNSTSYCLNSSMSFAKSTMERLIRSSL